MEAAGVRRLMDGRGRRLDNVFIERLWPSLKYEGYLREMTDAFAEYRDRQVDEYYNDVRPSAFDGRTPADAYPAHSPGQGAHNWDLGYPYTHRDGPPPATVAGLSEDVGLTTNRIHLNLPLELSNRPGTSSGDTAFRDRFSGFVELPNG